MTENLVFTGIGHSYGKYKILNKDIEEAVEKGFLGGFSKEKISSGKKYRQFCEKYGKISEFEYFAGHFMGFSERHHVVPFPPTNKKLHYAETSLDLGVRAIDNALKDACLKANKIDAWFVSTVSPHEQAPGIANSIKSYFTKFEDQNPCFSLASGCSGFNINLERAIEYFRNNPDAKHIVVAHTETMSSFLLQRIKFVPFVTFGDAAAAVIISKIHGKEKCGIIDIVNLHDLNMLDHVGVDQYNNLYMDDSLIKDRAIINIHHASEISLKKSNLNIDDIDMLVPHQTGNIILHQAAENLGISKDKVYMEGQKKFGNVSGTTVPICLSLLKKDKQLKKGMKILSATAGVGGTYGAFTYIVPEEKEKMEKFYKFKNDLSGKTVLLLGASGETGIKIAGELEKRNAKIILHTKKNKEKIKNIKNAEIFAADFANESQVKLFINEILNSYTEIDFVINAVSSLDRDTAYDVNFLAVCMIYKNILPLVKSVIIQIGSVTEDQGFNNFDEWTSSQRSMHGFLSSASGELLKNGIKTIYFMPGFAEKGISENFDEIEKFRFMISSGQEKLLNNQDLACNIVSSLYLPKIRGATDSYENAMLVRRIGYKAEVDV